MDRDLPQDILGYILAELPDLFALMKAIRLSKRVYGAYQAHARGIAKAVAHNQFGSEINIVLRLIQEQVFSEEHPGNYAPVPELNRAPEISIGQAEIRLLCRNAWAVRQLENFFSQKYKDRTSSTSRLEAAESQRLIRALYALWLIIDCFAPRWSELPVPPLTSAEMRTREALHARQRTFTFALLPDEDARRDMVNAFMFITKDVTSWIGVCCCNSISHADILFIFPRLSFSFTMFAHVVKYAGQRAYTPYTPYGHSPIYALREAFNRLFADNAVNLGAQLPASNALGFLNQTSRMFEDACSRCSVVYQQTTHDPELYDARNWRMLNGDIPLREIASASFPGNLLKNRYEEPIITRYFEGTLFDRAQAMQDMLSFSGQGVTPGTWLCRTCIKDLLSRYAMAWWIEHLKNNGRDVERLEACSGGYACTVQKINAYHAENLNHFKKPDAQA
ncbi:hypothetical protein PENSPDRAFT_759694 [Peniophora sp. CONT]|nr:hypothetical protein PENSPDRAFT_759694 [Peniophora sp. CONT]